MLPIPTTQQAVFDVLANQRKEDGFALVPNIDIAKCAQTSKGIYAAVKNTLSQRHARDRQDQDTVIMSNINSKLTPEQITELHGYRLFAEGAYMNADSQEKLDTLFDHFNGNCDYELQQIDMQDKQIKQQKNDFYQAYKAKLTSDQQIQFERSVYQEAFSDYCIEIGKLDDNSYALIHLRQAIELKRQLLIVEYISAVQQRNPGVRLNDISIINEQINHFHRQFTYCFENSCFLAQHQADKISVIFSGCYVFLDNLEQFSLVSASPQLHSQFVALRNNLWEQSMYYALKQNFSLITLSSFFNTASFVFFNK